MHALYLIEIAVFSLFVYSVITQVAMPLWRDTPIFPMLRSEGKLEIGLKDANQGLLEAELTREIQRRQEEAQTIRENGERNGTE